MITEIIVLISIAFVIGIIVATIACIKLNRISTVNIEGTWPFVHVQGRRASIAIFYTEPKNVKKDSENQQLLNIDEETTQMLK